MILARSSQRGFSLLELLVAFAIMAFSLGLLYRSMGSSARAAGDMALKQQATLLAASLLVTRDDVPQGGWVESGSNGQFSWEVSSQSFSPGLVVSNAVPVLSASASGVPVPSIHEVVYSIRWLAAGKSQALTFSTLLPVRGPVDGERIK